MRSRRPVAPEHADGLEDYRQPQELLEKAQELLEKAPPKLVFSVAD
jgi:hypothetical protein